MNFKYLKIQTIRPLAVLTGGLDGTRFIAEVTKENGKSELFSFMPPNYDPTKAVPVEEYILDSAIEKHGFKAIEHEPITSYEDYEKYLREINQLPRQE